jgi:signal transduction histidine kinase
MDQPAATSSTRLGEPAETAASLRARFMLLLEAGISIASEHSLDRVLQKVVDSAREVVGARYAALGVIGPDGSRLNRFETSGLTDEERRRIGDLPTGHGILGLLVRDAKPLRIPRISDDARRYGFPPNHPPMESFLGVPIKGRDRIFGNLYLTEKIGAAEFSEEDERIAVLLAARAATAIDAAMLLDEQAGLLHSLQTMQRQRDQFFAMINHELRNALTGVYGWAEQLIRAKSPGAVERAGREVYESAERTITLLNNLLDLSRLDAGKVQTVFRRVALSEIITRATRGQRPAAEAKRLVIREDLAAAPDMVETDPIRLEGILVNLMSNAIRHSPPGETIELRAEQVGEDLIIHVSDHGPGIAREDQPRIFEPFIRVDPESGLGSGLGLPVSRRMAELIGGRLNVSSDLGRGATFTLTLSSPLSR